MKNLQKIILLIFLFSAMPIFSELASTKSYYKRSEILDYIKKIEISVKNLKSKNEEQDKMQAYQKIKDIYEEATIFYLEGDYRNSYKRFLDSEILVERIMEEISQYYIERTQEILKDSIEVKDKENQNDKTFTQILTDYSKFANEHDKVKRSRHFPFPSKKRSYDAKNFHYIRDNEQIRKSIENSYAYLRGAKDSRVKALKIGLELEDHKQITTDARKERIGYYFDTVTLCKKAKLNAIKTFQLKYPHDNYYLRSQTAMKRPGTENEDDRVYVEDYTMNFTKNKYLDYNNISPIFDNRIPAKYKVDAVDIYDKVYEDEIDEKIKYAWDEEGKKTIELKQKLNTNNLPANSEVPQEQVDEAAPQPVDAPAQQPAQ